MDFSNVIRIKDQFYTETLATLYMLFWTGLIAGILGMIMGILLILTREGGLMANRGVYNLLDKIVNIGGHPVHHHAGNHLPSPGQSSARSSAPRLPLSLGVGSAPFMPGR